MEHRTIMMKIKLLSNDYEEFLSKAEQLKSGIVEVAQGNNVLSGKSLLGLSLIDTNKPQTLIIRGFFDDEFIENFKKWEIPKHKKINFSKKG